jgi:hypothetical protein
LVDRFKEKEGEILLRLNFQLTQEILNNHKVPLTLLDPHWVSPASEMHPRKKQKQL